MNILRFKPLSPKDIQLANRLKPLGIKMPIRCVMACRATGLQVPLGASILIQESGGGKNLWGHDPTIFAGGYDVHNHREWGAYVSKAAYLEYKRQRGPLGRGGMQGVGPVQLTYYAFQDEADRLGGCWRPLINMYVGFNDLAHNVRRSGLHKGVAAYNGSGPSAERYAEEVIPRAYLFAKHFNLRFP